MTVDDGHILPAIRNTPVNGMIHHEGDRASCRIKWENTQ